jgi:thioredoxin family protein
MCSRASLWLLVLLPAISASAAQNNSIFPPIEQWKAAVISGNPIALRSIYSTYPPAVINTSSGKTDADSAVAFWTGLKARSLTLKVLEASSPRADLQAFTLLAKVREGNGRTTSLVEGQTWQDQGGTWRMVGEKRDVAKLEQPATMEAHIYPTGDAHQQIQDALARAAREHKNLLLVFGADWCYDCHVLDKAFHRPDVALVLNANYELVNIDIGEGNKNLDLAAHYEVPLNRGVPAVAVLDSTGKLLYSQQSGEWERARALAPEDLVQFLKKWKPQGR